MVTRVVLDADTPDFTRDSAGEAAVQAQNYVIGSDDANIVGADAKDDLVEANGGNDNVNGGNGNDTLVGGDGDDTLNGGDSHDKVLGDDGNDLLLGSFSNSSDGEDTLYGGDGEDVYVGFAGDDTILAGERTNWNGKLEDGQDVILFDAQSGNDSVWGFSAADDLFFITDGVAGEGFAGIAGLSIEVINNRHTFVTYETEEGTTTVNVRNEVLTEENFSINIDDVSATNQDIVEMFI